MAKSNTHEDIGKYILAAIQKSYLTCNNGYSKVQNSQPDEELLTIKIVEWWSSSGHQWI